jgi:hypothetical protein
MLLLIALHNVGWSQLGAAGTLAGVAARAPLPQEIPALVERHAQLLQPLPIGVRGVAGTLSLPEPVLFLDHPVDRTMNLRILHNDLL